VKVQRNQQQYETVEEEEVRERRDIGLVAGQVDGEEAVIGESWRLRCGEKLRIA
jgi:hypothetical protein